MDDALVPDRKVQDVTGESGIIGKKRLRQDRRQVPGVIGHRALQPHIKCTIGQGTVKRRRQDAQDEDHAKANRADRE